MIDTSKLPLFVLAAAVLIVIPGPSVFYIITRSLDQGRMAGIASTLGVTVGAFLHIAAAALGLSAVLASSAVAFNTVKYLGAAYLVYLGVRRLLLPSEATPVAIHRPERLNRVFYEGILVNLLNPKTALFFMAFLPQFVHPSMAPVGIQVMLWGSIFVVIGIVSDGTYALFAGGIGNRLRGSARVASNLRWLSGGTYIALGVATVLAGPGRSK